MSTTEPGSATLQGDIIEAGGIRRWLKLQVPVPREILSNRRLWYTIVWGISIGLSFLIKQIEPGRNIETIVSKRSFANVPDLLWCSEEEAVFLDRDISKPRLLSMALDDNADGNISEITIPTKAKVRPLAADFTPEHDWMAVAWQYRRRFFVTVWEVEHPDYATDYSISLEKLKFPGGAHRATTVFHDIRWLGGVTWSKDAVAKRRLLVVFNHVLVILNVKEKKTNSNAIAPAFEITRVGDALLGTSWQGNQFLNWRGRPMPDPKRPLIFAASVRLQRTKSAASKQTEEFDQVWLFQLQSTKLRNGMLRLKKICLASKFESAVPTWTFDGNTMIFQGRRLPCEGQQGNSEKPTDLYKASVSKMGDLLKISTPRLFCLNRTDGSRLAQTVQLSSESSRLKKGDYGVFVVQMKNAGSNLWMQPVRAQNPAMCRQISTYLHIVSQPMLHWDGKRLYIAAINQEAPNERKPVKYKVHVMIVEEGKLTHLFATDYQERLGNTH